MNLEEMQDMWEVDCVIDDNHLGEHSTATPKLHAKYLRLLVGVKLKATKLKADISVLRKNKFRYYRGELSREELTALGWPQWQGLKPLKSDMEEFLSGDEDLNKAQIRLEYLNTMIYFLESVMSQIKSRGWDIKNGIMWKQFLAGN